MVVERLYGEHNSKLIIYQVSGGSERILSPQRWFLFNTLMFSSFWVLAVARACKHV